MTEDQAKTKWCPMVRVIIGPDNAAWQSSMLTNRGDIPAANTNLLCIASDCMMWVVDTPKGSSRSEGMTVNSTHEYGHCGLAK